jgi:DNA-binding transcriptional LysR family regulator
MELHQVRYLLAVVSTLNFTRAAAQCNVTQPALTKGIKKLEDELGGQLIHRERQLTQLTELGKAVLPMLQRTLESADAVCRGAREFQNKEVAPLRIGLAPSVSASLLPGPLVEIGKQLPGLRVELSEDTTDELVEALLEGRVNAAIVGEFSEPLTRIDSWALFEERYVVVLSRDHHLANRSVISPRELGELTILERIGCDVCSEMLNGRVLGCGSSETVHRSRHESHLQYLVAGGFGIILAPEHVPQLPSLKKIRIEGDPARREVRLLAVQGRHYSPALDALIKVAKRGAWLPAPGYGALASDIPVPDAMIHGD